MLQKAHEAIHKYGHACMHTHTDPKHTKLNVWCSDSGLWLCLGGGGSWRRWVLRSCHFLFLDRGPVFLGVGTVKIKLNTLCVFSQFFFFLLKM